ncbi:MFS transporter [Acidaminobacter hydrogenoformans]|uniref:MFS transporter, OFA family, oxalate/formate antiporter n=1 Tax=Acidaminobacter hydrogenoformans DSM 2784 TaxID=1120920 RepID=A0A1G5S2E8_9FIRM|nr:MFS transporter [Acidaminobacter hydrogenoformans]SCZ80020.1 MFS transporter, OFA family, oxalate/formate antiporter [Acidaminobacter hydrogenoformans DSM 2784]
MNLKIARTLTVLTSMLMLLCLGLIYGWSIFVAPLEAEFGWVRAQTSLTFTISMAMFCIGGLAAGMLLMRGVKRSYLMVSAGVLLLGGFYAASYSEQLAHFYIFYGVFCGFGVGVSYNLLISAVTKLFPGKQGFISGILMMSFGFGGLVLGSLCASLLISLGWRSTFKIIGILIGLIVIVGSVVIDIAGKKLSSQLPVHAVAGGGKSEKEISAKEYAVSEMMKSPSFLILFAWLVLLSSAGLMIIGHVAPSILELGAEPATAAMAVGVVSVSNGVGRVVFGLGFDRIGMKKTLWLINFCLLTAGLLLSFAVSISNIGLLLLGCAFMGISYGGSPVSTSAVVHKLFGHQNFSGNFSVAVTNLLFAALIGPTVAASLQSSTGSYQTSFYVLIGIGILALGLCWLLTRRIQEA